MVRYTLKVCNCTVMFYVVRFITPHTDKMRSPLRSSPQRSAGPPARIKEMKMPSPSSPPTMLKPRPVEPRWSTTRLGSLEKNNSNTALAQFSFFLNHM